MLTFLILIAVLALAAFVLHYGYKLAFYYTRKGLGRRLRCCTGNREQKDAFLSSCRQTYYGIGNGI